MFTLTRTGPTTLRADLAGVPAPVTLTANEHVVDVLTGQAARDGILANCGGAAGNAEIADYVRRGIEEQRRADEEAGNVLPAFTVNWDELAAPCLRQPAAVVLNNDSGFPSYEPDWQALAARGMNPNAPFFRAEPAYAPAARGAVVPGGGWAPPSPVANTPPDDGGNLLPDPGEPDWAGLAAPGLARGR